MSGQNDDAIHRSVLRSLYAELNDLGIPGQRQAPPAEMPGLRQWFDHALDVSAAGIDGFFFRYLANRAREPAIFLRERDLTFFGVEDWSPNQKIEHVKGEGEFPVLYKLEFAAPASTYGTKVGSAREVTLALLVLVEFVHRSAGSGLGVAWAKPKNGESHDLKDIRRFRYQTRQFTDFMWIERADGGRRTVAEGVQPRTIHRGVR